MPLLGRKAYNPPAPQVPEGVPETDGLYVIRLTGEVFSDYEDYLTALDHYRQRQWTCSITGTGNLTYEEALQSESEGRALLQQFPLELEPAFLQAISHSSLRLEELVTHLHKLAGQGVSEPGRSSQRAGAPLAKPVIRLWLQEAAVWTGRYWALKPELSSKYGLGGGVGGVPEEPGHEEEPETVVVGGRRGRGTSAARAMQSDPMGSQGEDSPPPGGKGGPLRAKRKKAPAKSLEEEEERAKPGTTKHAALQVLKAYCPYEGLTVEQVIKLSVDQGIKTDWPPGGKRNLYHVMHTDPAFLRATRNTYVLAAQYPDRDEWVEEGKGEGRGGRKPTKKELDDGADSDMGGGGPSQQDPYLLQRLELQCQQMQQNVAAAHTGIEVAQSMVAAARTRLAEAEAQAHQLAAHPQLAAMQPDMAAAAALAVDTERGQLALALGEVDRAQRMYEAAARAGEEADKAVLRERIRQAPRGGLDNKVDRERAKLLEKEDKERRKVEAAVSKRYPIDDTELMAEEAARAAERGQSAYAADVFVTQPYDEAESRRLADSLYLADLLFQLGGEISLRVVRYAHVDTLLLGGRNQLSVVAAAEQIIAAKEYAEETAAAAALAAAHAAAAAQAAADLAAGIIPPRDRRDRSKKKGGAAAAAAAAAAAIAAAAAAAELNPLPIGDGSGEPEAIIVDRVGDPTLLSDLYVQLLKNLLMDVWEQSSMARSERRWLEVLDEGTWAEVLRRYAIVRAGAANREPLSASAVAALSSLGRGDAEFLTGSEHVALMLVLCEDLMDMERMRNWLQRRLDWGTQVAANLRAELAEERKKLRELAGAEKEAKKRKRGGAGDDDDLGVPARGGGGAAAGKRIKLSGAAAAAAHAHVAAAHAAAGGGEGEEEPDLEDPPEPDLELPEELRAYAGDPADRQSIASFRARLQAARHRIDKARAHWETECRRRQRLRDIRARATEAPHERAARERREAEEALITRQEALEKELDRSLIRRAPLGMDRHHRRYWWGLAGLRSLVLVEHTEGVWSTISTPEQLDALMYSLDTRGVRELELKKALEKAQPVILAAMAKVRELVEAGEAGEAAVEALGEATDAMDGIVGTLEDDPGMDLGFASGPLAAPYRAASLRQLVDCVVEMTGFAETEDVPGPRGGWRDWRERFVAVAEGGVPDPEWTAEDAAEAATAAVNAAALAAAADSEHAEAAAAVAAAAAAAAEAAAAAVNGGGSTADGQPDLPRVYSQLSRRLVHLQKWFFAHSGQEGHVRFTENMPAPGGTGMGTGKAAAGAGVEGGGGEGGTAPGTTGGPDDGGSGSDSDGEDGDARGLSEAPKEDDEDGEDERRRKERMKRRDVAIDDDSPELVDRDLTRDEEKSRSSNGFCRHFMWRSKKEQGSWVLMAEKAMSAPRLAYCATTLAFHSAGLLGMTLKWAKKPKKH